MDWLSDWDDLLHGTAVFSAAIPFLLGLGLCWKVPSRWWWSALVLALVPVAYWLFKLPLIPPSGSDDVVGAVLLGALALLLVESWVPKMWMGRVLLFLAIAWCLYPAWLSEDGGLGRKLLVCGGFGVTIAGWSVLIGWLAERRIEQRFSLTPAALIPPAIALAVLLQTGGSMRFAQVIGALAAGVAAVCVAMLVWRKPEGQEKIGALWGMVFGALAWSGWLFAEIRYGLACLLLVAPLAACAVGLIPRLPRSNLFLCLLWDFLASASVAVPVAAIAAINYAEETAEFEGY